jgi:hypothetical protein
MIPAPEGLQAHYEREASGGTAHSTTRDVLAFADEGTPLVLGGENHGWGLVPASAYPGFTGIYPGDMPLVMTLPADGWRVEYAGDDGKNCSEPVVGWGVTSKGHAIALTYEGDGLAAPVSGEIRVYHEEEPPPGSSDTVA